MMRKRTIKIFIDEENYQFLKLVTKHYKKTIGFWATFFLRHDLYAEKLFGFGDKIKGVQFPSSPPLKKKKELFVKEPLNELLRWEIFERDNFTCKNCGSRKFLTVDHIHPESKGGKSESKNLQTLCRKCNSKKGDRI